MAKCELCDASMLMAFKIGKYFYRFHGREGYFPDEPHTGFGVDDCKVCSNCIAKLYRLYGTNGFNGVSDYEINEAKNYAVRNRSKITNPAFTKFVDYSISVAERLLSGESESKIAARKNIDSFMTANKQAINALVAKLRNAQKVINKDLSFFLEDKCLYYTLADLYVDDFEKELKEMLLLCYEYEFANAQNKPVTINDIFPAVALDDILYFCKDGDVQYASVVEGGGGSGGGANLSGALLGGLMFGGVGALVGSQYGTDVHINPIHTSVEEIDTRKTLLVIRKGNAIEVEEFMIDSYNALLQLIPTKERNYVISHQEQQAAPAAPQKSAGLREQLAELKELLDMGIISQEEFDAKKKQLLGL